MHDDVSWGRGSAAVSGNSIALTPTDVRVAGAAGAELTTTARSGTIVLSSETPIPGVGGGGGGGGCALSDDPSRGEGCLWLVFALALAMIGNHRRASSRRWCLALGTLLWAAAGATVALGDVAVGPAFAEESIIAAQQVTIGPLTPSGAPGQTIDFDITYSGPTDTNGISFSILYSGDAAAVFTPVLRTGSQTSILCTTAPDLPSGIGTVASLLPNGRISFTVLGLSPVFGPVAFGRTGLLGACKFLIAEDASGTLPLACDRSPGATTASDVNGNDLPATCVDGTLAVQAGPSPIPSATNTTTPTSTSTATTTPTPIPTATPKPCSGDLNRDGLVSTAEATAAILGLVNRNVADNPAADTDHDGSISTAEATQVLLNLVRRTCD